MEKFITNLHNKVYLNKDKLITIFLNTILIFYVLQLCNLNQNFIVLILLISYILFIPILFSKKINILSILLLTLCSLTIYTLMNFDSRYFNIILITIVLWKENLKLYLKSLFYSSLVSFGIALIIGFSHINGMSIAVGMVLFLYFMVFDQVPIKCNILLFILLNIFLFTFVKSGQSIVCINFCFISMFSLQYNIGKKLFNSKIWIIIFPLLATISIYFSLSIHNNGFLYLNTKLPQFLNALTQNFLLWLDKIMSYRLSLSNISLHRFGFKFYGNTLNYSNLNLDGSYFNVDSGYLHILQGKGSIVFLVILALLTIIILYFFKTKNYKMIVISITLALWSINEDLIMTPYRNVIWIYLADSLYYLYNKYKLTDWRKIWKTIYQK